MSRRTQPPPTSAGPPKREGYSRFAFFIILITAIILTIALIIILIFYFRKNASLIDPKNCPTRVTGLLAVPDTQVQNQASNCGNVANCIFTVNSLSDAQTICRNLGTSKCASFSLQQQLLSNNFSMTVSSDTSTVTQSGTDTYRFIN